MIIGNTLAKVTMTPTTGVIGPAQVKVAVNPAGGLTTTTPVTLKADATMIGGSSGQRLDGLFDVVEGPSPTTGSTLVYDAVTDTYIVKQMDLDGGTF